MDMHETRFNLSFTELCATMNCGDSAFCLPLDSGPECRCNDVTATFTEGECVRAKSMVKVLSNHIKVNNVSLLKVLTG